MRIAIIVIVEGARCFKAMYRTEKLDAWACSWWCGLWTADHRSNILPVEEEPRQH
jgi:hypothetical protein